MCLHTRIHVHYVNLSFGVFDPKVGPTHSLAINRHRLVSSVRVASDLNLRTAEGESLWGAVLVLVEDSNYHEVGQINYNIEKQLKQGDHI